MAKADKYADTLTGPYLKMNSLEAATLYVRNIFPTAMIHNGENERTFVQVNGTKGTLVAHVWMTGKAKVDWHVRVKDQLGIS